MALTNMGFNTKIGLQIERTVERERREEEKREEEEEEEEEEKRKKRSQAPKRYGTMTFSMDLWNFKTLYG